jgi:hypothetical protein
VNVQGNGLTWGPCASSPSGAVGGHPASRAERETKLLGLDAQDGASGEEETHRVHRPAVSLHVGSLEEGWPESPQYSTP